MCTLEKCLSHMPLLHGHKKEGTENVIAQKHLEHLIQNQHKWTRGQRIVHEFIQNTIFEGGVTFLVIAQMCVGIHQTDLNAENKENPIWMKATTSGMLCIYCIELTLRFYVYRLDFFRSKWHWLDISVVAFDVFNVVLSLFTSVSASSFAVLRVFRILRVARAARLLRIFPELFIMIHSLAGTIRVVFWAGLLVLLMMTVWSIMAVDLIHPINVSITEPDDKCRTAFNSVFNSNLTFLQVIVAGDSFGTCTMPIMKEKPWTVLYFTGVLATVGLGALNLILSAIVDRATEVRSENDHLLHLTKMEAYEKAKDAIKLVCEEELDGNQSGQVSLDVLVAAIEDNEIFSNALERLGLGKADVQTVFYMMDEERKGEVSYVDFSEHLLKLKTQDQQMLLILIKQFMNEAKSNIQAEFELMKEEQVELQQIVASVSKFDKTNFNDEQSPKIVAKSTDDDPTSAIPLKASPRDFNKSLLEEPMPVLSTVMPAKEKSEAIKNDFSCAGDCQMHDTIDRIEPIMRAISESVSALQSSIQDISTVARLARSETMPMTNTVLKQAALGAPTACEWDLPTLNPPTEQKLKVTTSGKWPCCAPQEQVVQVLPPPQPSLYQNSGERSPV